MKRSLTIGCVLLVGGGVTNCGGSAEMGSVAGHEPGAEAGSAAVAGHFMGTIPQGGRDYVGDYVGSPVEVAGAVGVGGAGGAPGTGPYIGSVPQIGEAGAPDGWGAGAGGESGSSNDPPAVGTAPLGGAGGFVGVPPK